MSSFSVKPYYRIGEVSQIVGVQPHVLRYWETEFRTIRPQKSTKGQRVYSRKDVEKLLRVKDLLRNQGFTIAGARKRLRDSAPGDGAALEEAVALVQAELAAQETDPEEFVPESGSAKKMRRALVSLRTDILEMLRELDTIPGRPDHPPATRSGPTVGQTLSGARLTLRR